MSRYVKDTGVDDADDEPAGTPHPTLCVYATNPSLSSVIATKCDRDDVIHEKVNHAVPASYSPVDVAKTIIDQLKNQPSNVYFKNPNLQRDLEVAEDAFSLIDAGHSSLLPNGALGKLMKSENIDDWGDFKQTVKSWSKGSTKNMKKLGLAVASGALDVVANFAGPLGAGLSLVGAVLNFWETNSLDKQLQELSEKLLKEVAKMIDRNAAKAKTREVNNWLKGFISEMGFVSSAVQQMAKEKLPDGGMHQFALINALQADLATTRFQWMPYADGTEACQAPYRAGHHMGHACVVLRNTLAFTVPTLATMHLAMIDMMISAVGTRTNIVRALKTKYFELVKEYYLYLSKFKETQCLEDNYHNWHVSNQAGKIIVCMPNYNEFLAFGRTWDGLTGGLRDICNNGVNQKYLKSGSCPYISLAQVDGKAMQEPDSDFEQGLVSSVDVHGSSTEEVALVELTDLAEYEDAINEHRTIGEIEQDMLDICGESYCLHSDLSLEQHASLKLLSRNVSRRLSRHLAV